MAFGSEGNETPGRLLVIATYDGPKGRWGDPSRTCEGVFKVDSATKELRLECNEDDRIVVEY
jgi:hypothetical protein